MHWYVSGNKDQPLRYLSSKHSRWEWQRNYVTLQRPDHQKKLGPRGSRRRIEIIWMPYILTSTANPSSPQSWVRMETDSVLSGQSEFMNHRIQNGHRTTPRPLPPLKGTLPILLYPNLIFLWTYIRVVLTRQFSQMEDSKVNLLCRKLYPRLSWRSFHLRFIHWGNG